MNNFWGRVFGKKLVALTIILIALFLVSLYANGYCAVGHQKKKVVTVYRDVITTKTEKEVHRIVSGSANGCFNNYGSVWRNMYGDVYVLNKIGNYSSYSGNINDITDAERDWLDTLGRYTNGARSTQGDRRSFENYADTWNLWGLCAEWTATYGAGHGSRTGFYNQTTYSFDLTSQTYKVGTFTNETVTTGKVLTGETISYEETRDTIYEVHTRQYTQTEKQIVYQPVFTFTDCTPLVLDLDENGKLDVAYSEWHPHAPTFFKEYAKMFDITGDGGPDLTEWMKAAPKDGILVKPENGKVESALQMFGNAGGFADGFDKLSVVCDHDKNGWVEGSELKGLMLWIDENNNARCESSELKSLGDYGIQKISTQHNDYVSKYVKNDGTEVTMWDWWPCMVEVRMHRVK